ncbi:hypothetical protein KJ878_03245, partial [Patescibacteria group bacterium]|nr:hypothetical protein [Patescibacteria group bacterium]
MGEEERKVVENKLMEIKRTEINFCSPHANFYFEFLFLSIFVGVRCFFVGIDEFRTIVPAACSS